jgi:membrane-associated phospholipid phosphatase
MSPPQTAATSLKGEGASVEANIGVADAGMVASREAGSEHDAIPLFQPRPDGPAERFSDAVGDRHPVAAFFLALISGYVLLAAASIALGLLVTNVLLSVDAVERLDERFPHWLAGERTDGLTDASWVGSELSGGYAIPAILALVAIVMVVQRKWRIAAYVVFAVAVESATYRATTLFVERQRPDVERLESLPVDASYPSGHTAASIALYSGLALLLTSRFALGRWRVVVWAVALAIPPIVALSRIYRGMHHPIDVLVGIPIGIAAIVVVVFACRVAGAAMARREGTAGAQ